MTQVAIIGVVLLLTAAGALTCYLYCCRKRARRNSSSRNKGSRTKQSQHLVLQEEESPTIITFPYVPSEPSSKHRSPSNNNKNSPYQQKQFPQSNPNLNTARPVHVAPSSLSHQSLLLHSQETEVVVDDRAGRPKSPTAIEMNTLQPVYLTDGPLRTATRPTFDGSPLPRPLNRLTNKPVMIGTTITKQSNVVVGKIKKPAPPTSSSSDEDQLEREQQYPPVTIVAKSPSMIAMPPQAYTFNKNSSPNGNQSTSPPLAPQKNARRLSNAKQLQQRQVQLQAQAQTQSQSQFQQQQQRSPLNLVRGRGVIEEVEEDERVSTENPFLGKEELQRRPPQGIPSDGYKVEMHATPISSLPNKADNQGKAQQDTRETRDPRYNPPRQPQHRPCVPDPEGGHEQKKNEIVAPAPASQTKNRTDDDHHEEMESVELLTTASLVLEPYLRATTPPPPLPQPISPPPPRVPSPIQTAATQTVLPASPPRRNRSITRPGLSHPQQPQVQPRAPTPLLPPSPTLLSPAQDSPIDPPVVSSSELEHSSFYYSTESSTTWAGPTPDIPHSLPPLQFSPLSSLSEIKPPSSRAIIAASETSSTTAATDLNTPPPLPRTQSKTPPPLPPPRGSRTNSPYDSSNSISTTGNISASISNTNTNSSRLSSALVSTPLSIQSRPISPQNFHQKGDSSSPTSAMSQTSPTSAKVMSPKSPESASSTNLPAPWVATGSDRYHNDDREETHGPGDDGGNVLPQRQGQESWDIGSDTILIQGSTTASSPGSSPAPKKVNNPQVGGTGTRLSHFNYDYDKIA